MRETAPAHLSPPLAADTLTRPGQAQRGRAHAGRGSFVAGPYSLFTWSEKQTASQLHSCHRATRRRPKLFMSLRRKGSRTRGENNNKRHQRGSADGLNMCEGKRPPWPRLRARITPNVAWDRRRLLHLYRCICTGILFKFKKIPWVT